MSKARDLADYVSAGGILTDGVISVSEINDLTATAAELNTLDGITATVTELNYMDGVTSAVQTQLDAKGTVSSLSDLSITATATELNYVSGVTSAIQTQLDAKGTVSSLSDLSVTATAAELNYNDITTLGLTEASKVVTADANGVVTFDNSISEESTTITSSLGAATINLRDGTNFVHDLTEDVTYTFSNPAAAGKVSMFTLKVIQGATARAITWPSSVDWAAATAPTLTGTNDGVDIFVFMTNDGGTTYYGFTAGQAMG